MLRTRFAPSPTGLLHIGNAYSALQCDLWAKQHQADLLLRVEDIDFTRCRPAFIQHMLDDLDWLGIKFDGEITYQQQRLPLYQQALEQLLEMDMLYPCFCTRKQLQGKLIDDLFDGYPGSCRHLSLLQRQEMRQTEPFSWRLDSREAIQILGEELYWTDGKGQQQPFRIENVGDVIIGRKDIHYSYHLAVVVDDASQDISHVIRGDDLRTSTPVHTILQHLLGYRRPQYHHHPLIKDHQGERLAKTKRSITLKSLRESGVTSEQLRADIIKC